MQRLTHGMWPKMARMLEPKGSDQYGRKRFTGRSLVALPHTEPNRERINESVASLAELSTHFGFDGSGDSFLKETTIFPEFGVASLPIDPTLLRSHYYDFPAKRLVVERERFVYAPMP